MISRIIFAVIGLICYTFCLDSKERKARDVAFYCKEYDDCSPGGPKICGFDEEVSRLAYFDDICTMFKANCRSAGLYEEVAMHVCDTKRDYSTSFKDELKFEKIIRPTQPMTLDAPMHPNEDGDETLRTANNTKAEESFDKKGSVRVEIKKENHFDNLFSNINSKSISNGDGNRNKKSNINSSYALDMLYMNQRIALLPKGGRKTLDKESEKST